MNESRARYLEVNRELSTMNRGWRYTIRSNGQSLPQNVRVQAEDGTSSYLNAHIGLSGKLVLVASDRHCSSCVDQLLFTLKNEIAENNRNHILILFSEQHPSQGMWWQRKAILTGAEFLEISERGLHLPMDSLEIPYFFLTGAGLTANLTYAPFPSLEEQTKEYLTLIEDRFFK